MQQSILFAKAFLDGKLQAFPEPIEDMDAFSSLSETYSAENADIESAVMEFAHGSCHLLTLALAEKLEVEQVMVWRDPAGMPVHSALFCEPLCLVLDANGVHHLKDCTSFWSRLAGDPLRAELTPVERLAFFYGADDDGMEQALEAFSEIHRFINQYVLPTQSPDHDSPSPGL